MSFSLLFFEVIFMDNYKILYICDGKDKCCDSEICGMNEKNDEQHRWCYHTTNREHALHPDICPLKNPELFDDVYNTTYTSYWEKR